MNDKNLTNNELTHLEALQKFWKSDQKKLPSTNCIIYADGRVTVLDFIVLYDPNTRESSAQVSPLCDTTIGSLLKYNAWEDWTWVGVWDELVISDKQKFVCGDGSYGNDGFVACEDGEGNLLWALFSDRTNPIKSLKVVENHLIGITEHGTSQIEINLYDLTDIKFNFITKNT